MKLLGTEINNGMLDKYWLHVGDDGKDRITIETIQDVDPIIKRVKQRSQTRESKDMLYVGDIPANTINEFCRVLSPKWGLKPREVMSELISSKTDRAKSIWHMLLRSRDYRKLQAKHYR